MLRNKDNFLNRIGVFYDGNYFLHVSNYYNYSHERKSRIDIAGLHSFIQSQVALEENMESRLCQIVDAHYFRGRLSALDAQKAGNTLLNDRIFDDILSSEGVTTHYLPLQNQDGQWHEKGIDVSLALEAFEQAFYNRFNVIVLIAADGDYLPLIRKLHMLGTRVMVLGWEFEYTTNEGRQMITRTAQSLLKEANYPVLMHDIIDDPLRTDDPLLRDLFVVSRGESNPYRLKFAIKEERRRTGEIVNLKNGFGFIRHEDYPENLFFHYQTIVGSDFKELKDGDPVSFEISKGVRINQKDFATNVKRIKISV